MWVQLSILPVLFCIIYDDLMHRAVRLFLFPLLAFFLIFVQLHQVTWLEIAANFLYNIAYILFLLSICFLYLKFRYLKSQLSGFLGWGDVLLLTCLAVWFEPVHFIFFNTLSFIAALLFQVILTRVLRLGKNADTIPLAGYQCICFSGIVIGTMF
jgi:hypothetical protein